MVYDTIMIQYHSNKPFSSYTIPEIELLRIGQKNIYSDPMFKRERKESNQFLNERDFEMHCINIIRNLTRIQTKHR
jgi:hypothetical protein